MVREQRMVVASPTVAKRCQQHHHVNVRVLVDPSRPDVNCGSCISSIKCYLLTSETLERHSCLGGAFIQSLANSAAIIRTTLREDTDQTTRWLINSVAMECWPCHFVCTRKDGQLKEALVINYWQALSRWFLSTCFPPYLSKHWASCQLLFGFFFFKLFQNESTHSNYSFTRYWNSNIMFNVCGHPLCFLLLLAMWYRPSNGLLLVLAVHSKALCHFFVHQVPCLLKTSTAKDYGSVCVCQWL